MYCCGFELEGGEAARRQRAEVKVGARVVLATRACSPGHTKMLWFGVLGDEIHTLLARGTCKWVLRTEVTRHLTCVYTQMCSVCVGAGYTDIFATGRGGTFKCVQRLQGACHLTFVTQICAVCVLVCTDILSDGARGDV